MDRHPLTPGGNTLVILDTCVLLPSRLSDVLFDLRLNDVSAKLIIMKNRFLTLQ